MNADFSLIMTFSICTINYSIIMSHINLADPELELIDPTPNVHALFVQFDKEFFWTKLASRSAVRWSKRMYSCAGICTYDRCYCDIALSEPLLKLRPRKDLVETLLHEMIHAFLFITSSDRDRDGHGPNFQAHMHRINRAAGLNISIYHDFHDEVRVYQTHWWRCDGPCVTRRPHFGIVRKSANRPPGPKDFWWENHKRICGGNFIKIKEPEKKVKSKEPKTKKDPKAKPLADITKYITKDRNDNIKPSCPKIDVLNNITTGIKNNSLNNINNIFSPSPEKVRTITAFSGTGWTVSSAPKSTRENAAETVRNIWANKQLPNVGSDISKINTNKRKSLEIADAGSKLNNNSFKDNRHDISNVSNSPPMKMKKIDDYFQRANTIIQELYGDNYALVKSDKDDKIIAVNKNDSIREDKSLEFVICPVCNLKIIKTLINKHLDECLNKDIVEELSKSQDGEAVGSASTSAYNLSDKSIRDNNCDTNTIDIANNLIDKASKNTRILQDSINSIHTEFKSEEIDFTGDIVIKQEPGSSGGISKQKCACCGKIITKPIEEHLDECLAFFDNNTTIPEERASTSIIVIDDDDDELDESQTMNETGTKFPCPSCLEMVEEADMNSHLDSCLS